MTAILAGAFGLLAASDGREYWRDVERVAAVIRQHGDRDTVRLLDAAAVDFRGPPGRVVMDIAARADAGIAALDLTTEFSNPGCHAHLGRRGRTVV
jgi:hypothetical protein